MLGAEVTIPVPTRLTFKMHGLSSLQKSLNKDSLTLRALAILFAGYVDGGDGQLFTGNSHERYYSHEVRHDEYSVKIARVTETKFVGGSLNVLPGINVQAKRKIDLVLTEIEGLRAHHNKEPHVGLQEFIEKVLPPLGLYPVRNGVWMLRKEAYRFACAYLKQKPSPHGFLFNSRSDFVLDEILWSGDIARILALAKTWLAKTGLARQMHTEVSEALRNVSEAIPTRGLWSRGTMQAISFLDNIIDMMASQRAVAPQDEDVMWMATRAIYASNKDFRKDLKGLLENLGAQNRQLPIDILRFEETKITLLGADGVEIGYSFDFRYTFPDAESKQCSFHNKTMSLIDTIMASLQGQLRTIAWDLALRPDYVSELKSNGSDTSFVDAYVPRLPGPEICLESTTHQPTSSPPESPDQYADINVALADIRRNFHHRRAESDRYEGRISGRTGIETHSINTSESSPPPLTRSTANASPASGDWRRNEVATANLARSLTSDEVLDRHRHYYEASRTRPVARAESSVSQASAPLKVVKIRQHRYRRLSL